jgi:hypothetical protein
LYGKALVNGIDAPQQPKVSLFRQVAVAEEIRPTGDKPSERYTVRQKERGVKYFLRDGGCGKRKPVFFY